MIEGFFPSIREINDMPFETLRGEKEEEYMVDAPLKSADTPQLLAKRSSVAMALIQIATNSKETSTIDLRNTQATQRIAVELNGGETVMLLEATRNGTKYLGEVRMNKATKMWEAVLPPEEIPVKVGSARVREVTHGEHVRYIQDASLVDQLNVPTEPASKNVLMLNPLDWNLKTPGARQFAQDLQTRMQDPNVGSRYINNLYSMPVNKIVPKNPVNLYLGQGH